MKRLRVSALLGCLLLAACAPGLTRPASEPDPDGGGLRFMGTTLFFGAGLSDVLDLSILISGTDLRVNAPQFCRVNRADIECTVPKLPKGGNFVLPMRGSNISAVATYKRLSGKSYGSEARQ
ncbi:hypothetical protein DAERI_060090 [Deinococcus aerius]|uniref:IPT/TIG domain-containing protein n=1 Tax=Deinococcus aerius TaxID=200253 RepID=A0A2I9D5Z3_9DEIO|nr:hypothetical protein [Deinococcus aerius]GBF05830.1 hypothetical protein DAERI_060090 [Deinococcus aerius]